MTAAALTADAIRIAIAILCDTAALVVWDVGTRSPQRLIADVRAGLRQAARLANGVRRLLVGACALAVAIIVSRPVAGRPIDFTVIECWALLTALIVEQLVGPDLRSSLGVSGKRSVKPRPMDLP